MRLGEPGAEIVRPRSSASVPTPIPLLCTCALPGSDVSADNVTEAVRDGSCELSITEINSFDPCERVAVAVGANRDASDPADAADTWETTEASEACEIRSENELVDPGD